VKRNNTFGLVSSLVVLIGFPVIFLIVSFVTGNWRFFLYSLFPSFLAGFSTFVVTKQQIKKEKIG